jgi:acetyl esterase/lipase
MFTSLFRRAYLCWLPLVTAVALGAAPPPPEKVSLWPDQAPIGEGRHETVEVVLTVYRPEMGNGTAVVICPGGGYGGLVTGGEGRGIAAWLNAHGITGAVLEYRLPKGNHHLPLADAQRALQLVRSRAIEWNLNPKRIGIIGFSAGGHLAATAATLGRPGDAAAAQPLDRMESRPDFAILIYPVISMGKLGHGGSRKNLLGENPAEALIQRYSAENQVTGQTPPCYLAHAVDDTVVSIEHSQLFAAAMKAQSRPCVLQALPSGGHGLNGYKGPMWDAWQTGVLQWLTTLP